ncbi:cuticle collagen 2-like [Passer domesticus]|uniref:cuticle collagen 2-like n=1 Tax=Passer domesticus TaxID=48849 RepID=UPI0030FE2571
MLGELSRRCRAAGAGPSPPGLAVEWAGPGAASPRREAGEGGEDGGVRGGGGGGAGPAAAPRPRPRSGECGGSGGRVQPGAWCRIPDWAGTERPRTLLPVPPRGRAGPALGLAPAAPGRSSGSGWPPSPRRPRARSAPLSVWGRTAAGTGPVLPARRPEKSEQLGRWGRGRPGAPGCRRGPSGRACSPHGHSPQPAGTAAAGSHLREGNPNVTSELRLRMSGYEHSAECCYAAVIVLIHALTEEDVEYSKIMLSRSVFPHLHKNKTFPTV